MGSVAPGNNVEFSFKATVFSENPNFTEDEHKAFDKDFREAVEKVYNDYGIKIKVWEEFVDEDIILPTFPPSKDVDLE